jgi:type IX secretion system PorP/SprF family membrane protein
MNQRKLIQLILLTIVVFSGSALSVHAQQEPNFSQYMFYGLTFNPAVAGSENAICVTGANRMQWTGFGEENGQKVAPRTYFVAGSAPIKILKGGLGLMIMQDALGYEKTIGVRFGYAYQRNMGLGKLGIGAQVEFNNKSIDFGKLKPAGEDPLLSQLTSTESDMLIDFSLGFLYRVPESFYFGVSGLHLVQTKGKPIVEGEGTSLTMKLDRTLFLTGGYEYTFAGNPDLQLLPSAIVETNLSKIRIDVNAILRFKEVFWGGLGYRFNESVIVLLGVQYKDFRIGYSYDINVNQLNLSAFGGSHEIMLKYCFKLEVDRGRKSYKNTRFL